MRPRTLQGVGHRLLVGATDMCDGIGRVGKEATDPHDLGLAERQALRMQVVKVQEQGDLPGRRGVGDRQGHLARRYRLVQGVGTLVEARRIVAAVREARMFSARAR